MLVELRVKNLAILKLQHVFCDEFTNVNLAP